MISIFAWLSLLSAITCAVFGTIVFFLRKEEEVRVYSALAIAYAYWAFTEFMLRQADLPSTAEFWAKLSFLWPICVALALHFVLAFTKNKILRNKITYVILYAPAIVFSYIDLTTNLIFGPTVLNYWGYSRSWSNSNWVKTISIFWVFIVTSLMFLVCLMRYLKVKDKTEKRQASLVLCGFSVAIIVSLTTQIIFPQMGIAVPELGNTANILVTILIATAIWKFGMFRLDPALVVSNVIATIPNPLILTNAQGKILTINKALVDFSGYREDEIVGKQIDSFYKSELLENTNLTNVLQEQIFKNYEIRINVKSGIEKFALLSNAIIANSKGRKIGMVIVLQDITERKNMESKLIKAERFASMGELAGMVGHDLRNPLMGIKTAACFLKKKYLGEIGVDGKRMLANIDEAIDYSNKMVDDLLDYSSEIKLDLSNATPRSLVNHALALIEVPQRIQIRNYTEEIPEIKVDTGKIYRVFVNLVKNAIDAMPENGVLTILSTKSEKTVEIVFKDNGIGMSEETLSHIWQPLFTTKAKGMGFGLSICKRIIEAHRGQILVKSKIGEGTEFTVVLPKKI